MPVLAAVREAWGLSRMAILWDGLLAVEVPAGWVVSEVDDMVEILPPHDDAAVHLSVLRRPPGDDPSPEEAAWLVETFAQRLASDDFRVAQREADDEFIASTSFTQRADNHTRLWEVGARVGKHRAVTYSYVGPDGGEELSAAALDLFNSIRLSQQT